MRRLAQKEPEDKEGEGEEGEGDDEETEESEIEQLAEAHKVAMVKAEERAQNLMLDQKCWDQASKIKASSSKGGAAPMLAPSIKASQKLRVQQKMAKAQQQQGEGPRKPHRYRPGTWELMEIRKYQKSVEFLIRKLPFQRVVQEIAQDIDPNPRFTVDAIFVLQEASEVFLVNLMEDENLCTIHRGRITIAPKDFSLVMHLREQMGDLVAFTKRGVP